MLQKIKLMTALVLLLAQAYVYGQSDYKLDSKYKLIAHRGGVVDEQTPENSIIALKKASESGYWMVEVDMRLTKDSVFITQHDNTFKRYFGVDRKVSDMNWQEIKKLRTQTGSRVLNLDYVLKFCAKHNLNVMIDNKVGGSDTVLFGKVVKMLDKYNLRKNSLMIGTDESTEYFTGKIRLSCNKEQLENNMKRKDYKTSNYYFFANPTREDMEWAKENDIMVVGVINAFNMPKEKLLADGKDKADYLKSLGIKYLQIDSMFDVFFREEN